MKKLLLLYGMTFLCLCGIAQVNKSASFLGRPTTGALPDSWFQGLSGGQIRHIKKPCGTLGNIPFILEKYEQPIWITGKKEDKESREKNHQYCEMQTKEVMAEFEKLKNKEIPSSATEKCFISVNAPLRPLRVYNYPTSSYFPYACIYFYAPYTLKNEAECFWALKTLAIFVSADGYTYITDTILDGIDGMKGKMPGNVVVGVQVDWRSVYVMNNLSQVIFVHYLNDRYGEAKRKSEEWGKLAGRNQDQRRKEFPDSKKTEPECFKFITVAHELLASKYSQHPPVFEKYGIGRCKHTPTHRGAGSVGISKVMSPKCFEDNLSFEVTVYKDESTGGNKAVLYRNSSGLKRHICNLDGDLKAASYVFKGRTRSTFYGNQSIDLYTNGRYSVEIDKDLNYIVFQKIKSTQKETEQITPKKKPEKRPYIKKTWPQGSKPGRIRKSPNNNTIETGQINPGDTIVIIDEQNGWSQVDLGNGTTGWIENEEVNNPDNSATQQKTTYEGGTSSTYDSLEDFVYLHELLHLKDFKKIHAKLESDGWKPTEPKDDYAGDFYLGKKFSATSPKTKNSITISKESKKKPDIILHLEKSSFEKVKEKAIVQNFSFDEEKTKRLSPSNSKDKSYYFQHSDGCIIHYQIMEIPPRSFISFSIR